MTSSLDELDRFKREVLQDRDIQHQLRKTTDRNSFISLLISLGGERGYQFTASEVEAAMAVARRTWLERWIQ